MMTLAVRTKVVGEADAVLESYNTPMNWKAISKCLTAHYADKRDLKTLEYQMFSLSQGRMSTSEFYQAVYHQLSLILNQIGAHEESPEVIRALTNNYRGKALDTFVRGLNGDLPRLSAIKEPKDLSHALHLCGLVENQEQRNSFAPKIRQQPPPVPPRQMTRLVTHRPLQNASSTQWRNFDPRLYHTPRPAIYQHSMPPTGANQNTAPQPYRPPQNSYIPYQMQLPTQGQQQVAPPRPYAPKSYPKPVPMEVDHSVRSKQIDYMNRPQDNELAGKRPPPQGQSGPVSKYQRHFHVTTGEPESDRESEYEMPYPPEMSEQAYYEYVEQQGAAELTSVLTEENEQEYATVSVDVAELNFLD